MPKTKGVYSMNPLGGIDVVGKGVRSTHTLR